MARRKKSDPVTILRRDIRHLDALIEKAVRVYDEAAHANARVGAIRTEAELAQRRRSVVLALSALIADSPGETLRAMRASAIADRSFKAAADMHAEEMRLAAEVPETSTDLETAYASLDLPTRRWLQRRLDEDLARSTG
tara:strand:- start:326 stop:742 length:417 start_codon:yes stop_codon:yes gene_type:complete